MWPKPDKSGSGLVWKLPELFQWISHHMLIIGVVIVGLALLKVAWQRGRRPLCNMIRTDIRDAWRAIAKGRSGRRRKRVATGLPDRLAFVDDKGPIDRIPFGVDKSGKWIHADLRNETPHVLISAATGWGKTSLMSIFVARVAGRGGVVDICDPKVVGFADTFRNIPNINIHTSIEDMTETITAFREEIQRRYELIGQGADINDHDKFPLKLLVLDEMGTLVAMMRMHYDDVKERGGPKNPPWLTQIMMILWEGRAARCHVITGAQQANAQVLINSDARDQYGLKIAAGPQSINAWRMMFGMAPPELGARVKGRAIAGVGSELVTVQLAQLNAEDARKLALGGRPDPGSGQPVRSPWSPDYPETEDQADETESQSIPEGGQDDPESDPETWDDEFDTAAESGPSERPERRPMPRRRPIPRQANGEQVPPRPGRPPAERRTPVTVTCECGQTWESRARDRSYVKCPSCRTSTRVPDRTDQEAEQGADQ